MPPRSQVSCLRRQSAIGALATQVGRALSWPRSSGHRQDPLPMSFGGPTGRPPLSRHRPQPPPDRWSRGFRLVPPARRPPSLDPPLPSSSQPERRAPAGRHSSSRWARLPGHGPSARLPVLVQRRFDAPDPLARSPSGDLGARGKPLLERHEHAPLQIGERTELGGEVEHFHRQVRAGCAPLVTGGDLAGPHYRTFRAQVMLRPVRQQVRPCPRRYACSASFDPLSHVPSKERLAVADQLSAARIPIAMPQVNLPPAPDGRPRRLTAGCLHHRCHSLRRGGLGRKLPVDPSQRISPSNGVSLISTSLLRVCQPPDRLAGPKVPITSRRCGSLAREAHTLDPAKRSVFGSTATDGRLPVSSGR